jgi:hypothetical protein
MHWYSQLSLVFAVGMLALPALGQSPVSLTIDAQHPGKMIPDDFSGISLEMGSLKEGNAGTSGNMFDDTIYFPVNSHKQVFTIFKELGLRQVRVGGGSVDMNIVPSNFDIDAFFRFVRIAGLRVTYSVRLLNGNITDDTNTVKYIWNNYGQFIDCFSIGNEPDWHSYHTTDPQIYETLPGSPGTAFPSYLAKWNTFAAAILTAAPGVKFGGPNTGSNYPVPGATNTTYYGTTWTISFLKAADSTGNLKEIYFHNYVGQGATGNTATQMIDKMLSAAWDSTYYTALYNASAAPAIRAGVPYRIAESNSFSSAVTGGSNSFATALFSLDYMHWWASHGAAGVNFHNKQWVGNGPIYLDASGNFQVYPVGYGIKAFDLGGHGRIDSMTITNGDALNLTAYAVSDSTNLYVTVINKEHGVGARDAKVAITANGFSNDATFVYLESPNGVTDTTGVTLGGASITDSAPWQGVWSPIDSVGSGDYFVTVPASSAAIVKIRRNSTSVADRSKIPEQYELYQNYPNPFNPTTVIKYRLPGIRHVLLRVFDVLGREVKTLINQRQNGGSHSVAFDAGKLTSGVYFYRLDAGSYTATMKMVLVK